MMDWHMNEKKSDDYSYHSKRLWCESVLDHFFSSSCSNSIGWMEFLQQKADVLVSYESYASFI